MLWIARQGDFREVIRADHTYEKIDYYCDESEDENDSAAQHSNNCGSPICRSQERFMFSTCTLGISVL